MISRLIYIMTCMDRKKTALSSSTVNIFFDRINTWWILLYVLVGHNKGNTPNISAIRSLFSDKIYLKVIFLKARFMDRVGLQNPSDTPFQRSIGVNILKFISDSLKYQSEHPHPQFISDSQTAAKIIYKVCPILIKLHQNLKLIHQFGARDKCNKIWTDWQNIIEWGYKLQL